MLVTILILLLVVVVLGAFIIYAGAFATDAGMLVSRKMREKAINASLPSGVRMVKETPQEKDARESRRRYLNSLADREGSPDVNEERERDEKRAARKRYLESLVDRE
jgi:hypothetical protein